MVCVWGPIFLGNGSAPTNIYLDGVSYDQDLGASGYDGSGNPWASPAKGGFSVSLNPYVTHTIYCDAGACPLAVFMSFK